MRHSSTLTTCVNVMQTCRLARLVGLEVFKELLEKIEIGMDFRGNTKEVMLQGWPLRGRRDEVVQQMQLLINDVRDRIEGSRQGARYTHHGKEHKADAKPKIWRTKRAGMLPADSGKRLCEPLNHRDFLRRMRRPTDYTQRNRFSLC